MQMGVWMEDNNCRRGVAGLAASARTGRRRESMPGEFFTELLKNII